MLGLIRFGFPRVPRQGSIGCYVRACRFLNKVLGLRS